MENNNLDKAVHKDSRGEIRRFEVNGTKFNILITKAGLLRSGDIHPATQYDLILEGIVEITMKRGNTDVTVRKGQNDLIAIPSGIPHLFKSITKSVVIEWWDGPFQAEYYKPYRKLIDNQIKD